MTLHQLAAGTCNSNDDDAPIRSSPSPVVVIVVKFGFGSVFIAALDVVDVQSQLECDSCNQLTSRVEKTPIYQSHRATTPHTKQNSQNDSAFTFLLLLASSYS